MKKIFTTLLIIFSCTLCKAQWVTIPDANFVALLQLSYPNCMNGNQMDTTCSEIVNATGLNCNSQNISNLTGVQYFNSLTSFYCEYNLLTTLPPLANSITYITCQNNQLTSLPALPTSLTLLLCHNNQLTSLPALPNSITQIQCYNNQLLSLPVLPTSLLTIYCNNNSLTSLPALPASLQYLYCSNNNLSNLPSLPNSLKGIDCFHNGIGNLPTLPPALTYLSCPSNNLSSLPTLPASLSGLYCYYNHLTSLPALPNSIIYLQCHQNLLTSLPALPTSLMTLLCYQNQLTSLPTLPSTLINLSCYQNQLTSLPTLPDSLKIISCYNNLLSALPELPNSLSYFKINNNSGIACLPTLQNYTGSSSNFNISNTGITCLPNVINHTGYIAAIDTMPICSCTFPSGITTSNITSTSAKVNWSTECCSQFQIQRRITGTTTWSTVTAVATATSKNLTALSPGTTYDIRMRVKCTEGTTYSSWSPIQTFTTLVSCVAPNGITISNLTPIHATINWSAVANAYSYKFSGRKLGTTTWTSYTIYAPLTVKQLNGLTANTTYQYRMQTVCNASGVPTSPWTAISTFSTPLRMEDESMEHATIDFIIYPNPVSQLLTVTTDFSIGDEIEIKDLLGRTLISQAQGSDYSNPAGTQASNTIDVGNLSAAQYFISIRKNDGSVLIKQFVKN